MRAPDPAALLVLRLITGKPITPADRRALALLVLRAAKAGVRLHTTDPTRAGPMPPV